MFTKLLTLSALFVSAYCLSGTVSEQNVTKREANVGDLFPDWVPFKNKHGDQLGEFVQVAKTSKVKKRLAPPINFKLKAVAEPNSDDYFEKDGGESDAEDYYEKKDWSDLQRPADAVDKKPIAINHTDLSDIDGVVDILTKRPTNPVIEAIYDARNKNQKEKSRKTLKEKQIERPERVEHKHAVKKETTETTAALSTTEAPTTTTQSDKNKQDVNNEEENEDYEDQQHKKALKAKEDKENEEKKAKILSGVDELKERHAAEQKQLEEKIRKENIFNDEFSKEKSSDEASDRFSEKASEELSERPNRNRKLRRKKPTEKPDYDEYEDLGKPIEDKYKINVFKAEPVSTNRPKPSKRRKTTTSPVRKQKHVESGKFSVFKNPHLFMVYDDNDESLPKTKAKKPKKFSAKYTTTIAPYDGNERISLVPVESKEGEPTLFYPKPRSNKRKKVKTTTAVADSTVAETVTDKYKETTAYEVTPPGLTSRITGLPDTFFTAPDSTETLRVQDTDTTGTDTVAVRTEPATDAVPAPSDHQKEHHKEKDFHREKGGGRKYHSEHSEEHSEHGKKAYEGHHEDTKTAKGYHDKENHLGKYDDKGGVDKHHSEESGHYGDHHHEEEGKKHAKYEESGKHSKGHNTKGSHDIHKKEEYEKNVEFFEEEGDSSDEEKHGGYNQEKGHSEGGKFSNGNLRAAHDHQHRGESGQFDKGGHHFLAKGHKQAAGHDGHGRQGQKHFQKGGKDGGRKWIFHHGHPAKTANLVVIDRRGEQYFHGPHYYG